MHNFQGRRAFYRLYGLENSFYPQVLKDNINMASTHFRFEMIDASKWFLADGTSAAPGSIVPRPHFVPVTDKAKKYIRLKLLCTNGLRRGYILRDNGEKEMAFSVLTLTEAEAQKFMVELDYEVDYG